MGDVIHIGERRRQRMRAGWEARSIPETTINEVFEWLDGQGWFRDVFDPTGTTGHQKKEQANG